MAFEAILAQPDSKPSRRRSWMLGISLVVHAVALIAAVIYSFWRVEEMPLPAIHVTLAEAPPPPPPPPPAGGAKSTPKPKAQRPIKNEILQPKEIPKESPKPEESAAAEGPSDGEKAGVAGGVAGGVVGGVVGGVQGAPPPPPPKDTGPKQVSASVGHRQLAINASAPPYCCPKIPRALDRSGAKFTAQVRVCVTADGQVTDARVLRGAGPGIDQQIPGFVRRWRYRPLMVDGRATPFCYSFVYDATVR